MMNIWSVILLVFLVVVYLVGGWGSVLAGMIGALVGHLVARWEIKRKRLRR